MRHVIWDWNGTLADDFSVVVDAVNASLKTVGEGPIGADDYRDHYTRPVRLFYDRLLRRPISDEEWLRIDGTFHDTYVRTLHRVGLTPDAEEAIGLVDAAGGTQSVLSMWWHDDLIPEVRRWGLDRRMVLVDGNKLDAGATKSRLLEEHLERLELNTPAVLIGDAIDDASAAIEVGIPVVVYDGGSHHRSDLDTLGVPVATSLCDAVALALTL